MKRNIKAQSLSMSTIIIIILVLLVLLVIGYFFIKGSSDFGDKMGSCLTKGGKCEYSGCTGGREVYIPGQGETMQDLCERGTCCVYT